MYYSNLKDKKWLQCYKTTLTYTITIYKKILRCFSYIKCLSTAWNQHLYISSRGTKKSQFRSYRRRKAKNAPKTKKSQQAAFSRKKKPVCALADEEKPISLVLDEKKSICAVLGQKITTNDISR